MGGLVNLTCSGIGILEDAFLDVMAIRFLNDNRIALRNPGHGRQALGNTRHCLHQDGGRNPERVSGCSRVPGVRELDQPTKVVTVFLGDAVGQVAFHRVRLPHTAAVSGVAVRRFRA